MEEGDNHQAVPWSSVPQTHRNDTLITLDDTTHRHPFVIVNIDAFMNEIKI